MAEGFVAEGRPYRAVPELWTNRCFTHRRPVRPTGAREKIKYPTSILYMYRLQRLTSILRPDP